MTRGTAPHRSSENPSMFRGQPLYRSSNAVCKDLGTIAPAPCPPADRFILKYPPCLLMRREPRGRRYSTRPRPPNPPSSTMWFHSRAPTRVVGQELAAESLEHKPGILHGDQVFQLSTDRPGYKGTCVRWVTGWRFYFRWNKTEQTQCVIRKDLPRV